MYDNGILIGSIFLYLNINNDLLWLNIVVIVTAVNLFQYEIEFSYWIWTSILVREDMDSYKLLIIFGRIFACIPWTVEKKRKKYQVLYCLIILALLVCIYLIFFRTAYDIFLLGTLVLKSLMLFKLMIQTIVFDNIWKEWNEFLEKAKEQFKTNFNESIKLSTALWILVANITFIHSQQVYLCYREEDLGFDFVFQEYVDLFSTYLPISFALIIKHGFQIVNRHSPRVKGRRVVVRKNQYEVYAFMELYKRLYKLTMCFNKLFGWIIILWLINMLVSSCFFIQVLIRMALAGILNMANAMRFYLKITFQAVSRLM